MKYPIYSIRDVKNGFDFPRCDTNDATAMRTFAFSVNNPDTLTNFAPNDYSLYKIGEFEVETGKIKTIIPELVCEAVDVFGVK